jgi:hypothetical protein
MVKIVKTRDEEKKKLKPLSEKEIEEKMKLTFSLGKSSHETIDEELYDDKTTNS